MSISVTKPHLDIRDEVKHGGPTQLERALALGSYFLSGCMVINISQFLGAPIYLMNRDWYNAWIAFTKQSFGLLTTTMTQFWAPTKVRISGHKSVRGQLLKTVDGNLICDFPERMVLISNHQVYTDWLYLWWIGYTNGMHGRIFIILKESLRSIPVLGWGMQLSQFIFLKRNWEQDKPNLSAHLQKLNKVSDPMWLMLFPEGTNLAPSTRKASKKWADKNGIDDMHHQLLPRSTGLQFCLQELRETVDYVYDCTIAYEGVPRGQYAQDIFTLKASYLEGRPPKAVNMFWRRFAVSKIPLDNPKAFEHWLRNRWIEKDRLIEYYYLTGRFPADAGVDKAPNGKTRRGAGYIETEIKAFHWYEFLQVFAPIGLFALVLYVFYGALPRRFVKSLNRKALVDKAGTIVSTKIKGSGKKLLMDAAPKVSGKELAILQKVVTNPKVVTKNGINQNALQLSLPPTSLVRNLASIQKPVMKMLQQPASAPVQRSSTKQAAISAPKQIANGSTLKVMPKKSAIQPKASTTTKKLEPKKPANKPQASTLAKKPAATKPSVKFAASTTPKIGTVPTIKPKTSQAPPKLAIKPKSTTSVAKVGAKQTPSQAPKKLATK